mgnify:CR=1 FL=1
MSYPNLFNYIDTNKTNINIVREICEDERLQLENAILNAANNASTSTDEIQEYLPLTQNITRAMGDFWFSVDGTIPPGGLPHLGHLVPRSTYGDFYTWVEANKIILTDAEWLSYAESHDGCCPHYSSGDGSTTFRTPSYPDTFLKIVSDINSGSIYEEEGLPNITGTVPHYLKDAYLSTKVTGAFYESDSSALSGQAGNGSYDSLLGFDASRSNSIYGNSNHVTPKNISILIGVYAVGAIVPVGTTDAEKIMSGVTRVEGLLDTKVDKSCVSSYFLPNYNAGILCGKTTSSTTPVIYTAPTNGIIFVDHLVHNNASKPAYIKINGVDIVSNYVPNTSYILNNTLFVIVSKDDVIEVFTTYTGTTYTSQTVYFYPFKG